MIKLTEKVRGGWLVWSHEHGAWWRSGRCGYTHIVEEAGRYSMAEAEDICGTRSPRRDGLPNEVMVPSPELKDRLRADESEMAAALRRLCAAIKLIPEDSELNLIYEDGEEEESIGFKLYAAEADARAILAREEARPCPSE